MGLSITAAPLSSMLDTLAGRRLDSRGSNPAPQVDSPDFAGASGALEAVQTRLYSDEVREAVWGCSTLGLHRTGEGACVCTSQC